MSGCLARRYVAHVKADEVVSCLNTSLKGFLHWIEKCSNAYPAARNVSS
jgi:hypothetical protein